MKEIKSLCLFGFVWCILEKGVKNNACCIKRRLLRDVGLNESFLIKERKKCAQTSQLKPDLSVVFLSFLFLQIPQTFHSFFF